MFRLHVIQAEFGDCLLLEYGTNTSRFILIDGGPAQTFQLHLRPMLDQIVQSGAALDLVVLSHVDTDHIIGLLDYFAELRVAGIHLPTPPGLWHNSFAQTIDPHGLIAPRLTALINGTRAAVMSASGLAVQGVAEGANLRVQALVLHIPINDGFSDGLITVDNAGAAKQFDNLEITVVGPTQANLDALERDWIAWLDSEENNILSDDPLLLANSDDTVPNLSSIMLLAKADNRTILLTGDGRSDHLLDGLRQVGLLDANERMHVDILKLPHHGSDRNITKTFFKKVTANTYVASANGRNSNPDIATLRFLVEAAQEQNRQVELVVTNMTPSIEELLSEKPMADFGYSLRVLGENDHSMIV